MEAAQRQTCCGVAQPAGHRSYTCNMIKRSTGLSQRWHAHLPLSALCCVRLSLAGMLRKEKASSDDRHHTLEAAHLYMQVMELGQVGHADDAEGLSAFYVHSQQGASFGDAGPLTQALLRAGDSKVCPCIAAICSKA